MKTVDALGYTIFADQPQNIALDKKTVINTINQYSYCLTFKDNEYKQALQHSNVLLPDGIGITIGIFFLYLKKIKKIAGADIHEFLLKKANKENKTCFYLGSSVETLQKIKDRLSIEYPNIKVSVYSPPYKPVFSVEDNRIMVEKINSFAPDILFIGLTAPKQEKWVEENKHLIQSNTICSIGAVFDFYSENIKRANSFFIKLGMEWLVRLFKEPRRMWQRYLYYGPTFIFQIIKYRFKG